MRGNGTTGTQIKKKEVTKSRTEEKNLTANGTRTGGWSTWERGVGVPGRGGGGGGVGVPGRGGLEYLGEGVLRTSQPMAPEPTTNHL